MAIKTLLGFLVGLFALGVLGGLVLIALNASRGRPTRMGIVLLVASLIGIAVIAPLNAGLVLVQPNEAGVVFRQTARGDAALLEPLQSGLAWVVPFVDQVIIYEVGQQTVTMAGAAEGVEYNQQGVAGAYSAVRATSNDGQIINVDVTIIFQADRLRVNDIHRNWRNGYVGSFIVPQTRSEVRNVVSEFGAEEIYSGGRATLETRIADALSGTLAEQGFILTDVLIRDISFSEQFTEAIEQKQIAEQQAQQAAFRVQQAQQEAEQARVEAQGLADSAVIAAEGEAQAITIRAAAESQALRLINEILSQNPALIQWQYINELSDQVELIIIPSNSPFLFDLQSLLSLAGSSPGVQPAPTEVP